MGTNIREWLIVPVLVAPPTSILKLHPILLLLCLLPPPCAWTYSDNQVLLQTARAVVYNPNDPSISRTARIVMDTGSQRSYLTDTKRRELELKTAGERDMTIMTFGSTQGETCISKYVRVGLKLKDGV